jgi:hypothetical protein
MEKVTEQLKAEDFQDGEIFDLEKYSARARDLFSEG